MTMLSTTITEITNKRPNDTWLKLKLSELNTPVILSGNRKGDGPYRFPAKGAGIWKGRCAGGCENRTENRI